MRPSRRVGFTTIFVAVSSAVFAADSRPPRYVGSPIGDPVLPSAAPGSPFEVYRFAIDPPDLTEASKLTLVDGAYQNGVILTPPHPIRVDLATANKGPNGVIGVELSSPGAIALRLALRLTSETTGLSARVSGSDGLGFAFNVRPDTGITWSPTTSGDVTRLTLHNSAREGSVEVVSIAYIFPPDVPAADVSCLIDGMCGSQSLPDDTEAALRGATAQLQLIKNGAPVVCTGTLINNGPEDAAAELLILTANHCIGSQSEANSLEAYWDYTTNGCNGSFPSVYSRPRSSGGTLLHTSETSDVSLVRLSSAPGGRWLMGWSTVDSRYDDGAHLYRLSHPVINGVIAPQALSESLVSTSAAACSSAPRSSYLYSLPLRGGVFGGSSGGAVVSREGYILGQLLGGCGRDPAEGCDPSLKTVDGSLRASYAGLARWIDVGAGATPSTCVATNTTACMLNNRFKVTVRYRAAFDNQAATTNALVKSVGGFANAAFETGFFYFNDPNNIEMMVKLLDQGNTNAQGQRTIAVLFGSATPLRIEVEITDSVTGAVKRYTSEFGQMRGATDFTAFVR
jgi:hypothetical protein